MATSGSTACESKAQWVFINLSTMLTKPKAKLKKNNNNFNKKIKDA